MKRLFSILACMLTCQIVLCSCSSDKAISYDTMMGGTVEVAADPDRIIFDDLDCLLDSYSQRGIYSDLALGEVLNTKHYIAYDPENMSFEGYAVSSVRLGAVSETGCSAGFAAGETVNVIEDYGVYFKYNEDFLEFLSKQTGRRIDGLADLSGLEDLVSELIPSKGKDYRVVLHENQLPLEEGKRYAFILGEYEGTLSGYGRLCTCNYAALYDHEETLGTLAEKYGFHFTDDYVKIAGEVVGIITESLNAD